MTIPENRGKELDYHDGPDVFGNTAKIWTTYNTEATKEDQSLSRNIREDMNNILVFAGVFSATVTAFVIESYKNLQPDPNSKERAILANMSLEQTMMVQQQIMMIQALIYISQQLANEVNISFSLPVAALQAESMIDEIHNSSTLPFKPTNADFTCNLFWFLSLLSCLGCALAACLAQQWARHFVQITESYTLPADRGRIRTYLLRGLHRFHLKNVIGCIPMLLHTSLFLFFGGLYLFLSTVNGPIGHYSLAVLMTLSICYLGFTILPLFYSDCPYNTPVSDWCWHGINYLRRKGYLRYFVTVDRLDIPYNTLEAVHFSATQRSAERNERDSWAMQMAVNILDNTGGLLNYMAEQCASQDAVLQRRLASLMNSTDLPSRFTQIFGDFRMMMLEDRVKHIVLCLQIVEKIRGNQKHYLIEPADGIVPRGHFDGEEHMAVAFAALVDFISRDLSLNLKVLPTKTDAADIKRRLGQYAFGILWRALSRLFQHARTLREGVAKLRISDVPLAQEGQMTDGDTTKGLWALIEVQKKELTAALEIFETAQLKPVAKIYPFLDEISKVWHIFSNLVDQTRVRLEGLSSFQVPARDSVIEETLSEYEDLLIHIHYLQLLTLFHSSPQCYSPPKELRWMDHHNAIVKNVEEVLSKFELTDRARSKSRGKLTNHLQLYFDHRLRWPHRGCRFTLVREKPSSSKPLHLENPSILLCSNLTDRVEFKTIIDGLKTKLKNDEKASIPNEPEYSKEHMESLRREVGTESTIKQYQKHARGKVFQMAEILDKAAMRTSDVSFLEGDHDWMKYKENYRDYIFPMNE